jgi:hypothetical protein
MHSFTLLFAPVFVATPAVSTCAKAHLSIHSRLPKLLGIMVWRYIWLRFARSATGFGFAELAGGLFDGVEETVVAQGLGLVQGQADVGEGFIAEYLIEQCAVSHLATGVVRAQGGAQRVRCEQARAVAQRAGCARVQGRAIKVNAAAGHGDHNHLRFPCRQVR